MELQNWISNNDSPTRSLAYAKLNNILGRAHSYPISTTKGKDNYGK